MEEVLVTKISANEKTWGMKRQQMPILVMLRRNCSRYFSRNRKVKVVTNRKQLSMNVRTEPTVLMKKNVQKPKDTNGCIFPKAF